MRVVGKRGKASIVEYECDGIVRRCLLPKSVIRKYGYQIPDEILDRGIEIGVTVEDAFCDLEMPSKEDLLNHLRVSEIWTQADILGNLGRFKLVLAEPIAERLIKIIQGGS